MDRKTGVLWTMLITAAVLMTAVLTVTYVQCRNLDGARFLNEDGSYSSEDIKDSDSNNQLTFQLNEVKLSGSTLKITVIVSRKDGGTFSQDTPYYMGYALEINGNRLGDDYVGSEQNLSRDCTRLLMESTIYLRGNPLKGHPTVRVNPQILSGTSESYHGNWILKTHVTSEEPQKSIQVNRMVQTGIGNIQVERLEIDEDRVLMFCSMKDASTFYNSYVHLTAVDNSGRYYRLYAGDRNENSICLVMHKGEEDEKVVTALEQDVREFTFSFARDKSLTGGGTEISEGGAFTVSLKGKS